MRESRANCINRGASSWHGTNNDAHTLSTVTAPLKSAVAMPGIGLPSRSSPATGGRSVVGASRPINADGMRDASRIPSALIGREAPTTDLPPVAGLERDGKPIPGIATADFKGAVTVLNVWASLFVPCHDEAPLLMQLARDSRIRVVGINYKDQADNARRFLGRYGNPFVASGADANGRAAIEWGVYGVPETFIVG